VKKIIKFCDYYKSYNKHNKYACCKKCSIENTKKTNLQKYGVQNVFQNQKRQILKKNMVYLMFHK